MHVCSNPYCNASTDNADGMCDANEDGMSEDAAYMLHSGGWDEVPTMMQLEAMVYEDWA